MASLRIIPATIDLATSAPIVSKAKRKVAGYARVSTDNEEQQTSYAAQVSYYTNYIKSRDDWEFVAVYTDEGISGKSIRKRDGFNRMVEDALAGRIDLIVTKSVSRFARNTVDSLTTIRKLKEHGTEVYFEKENIFTFDGKGEVLLTIMSSLAQEESRSISENTRWGQRKKFATGKFSLNYTYFLGYDKGPDGTLVVNPEQAKLVRRIFGMYLAGLSTQTIADTLTNEGVLTLHGTKWYSQSIRALLQNEKYRGDALLQKTYNTDFLSKRQKNRGEVQQYYVEGCHEAIIPPATFDLVQDELRKRRRSGGTIFSGKLFCAECGGMYGPKTWHSNDPRYRKTIWQCNRKFETTGAHKRVCKTPKIEEQEIRAAFEKALTLILPEKEERTADLRLAIAALEDTLGLEVEISALTAEAAVAGETLQAALTENTRSARSGEDYENRCRPLQETYQATEEKLRAAKEGLTAHREKLHRLGAVVDALEGTDEARFSPELWGVLVEKVVVGEKLRFILKDGQEVVV